MKEIIRWQTDECYVFNIVNHRFNLHLIKQVKIMSKTSQTPIMFQFLFNLSTCISFSIVFQFQYLVKDPLGFIISPIFV